MRRRNTKHVALMPGTVSARPAAWLPGRGLLMIRFDHVTVRSGDPDATADVLHSAVVRKCDVWENTV